MSINAIRAEIPALLETIYLNSGTEGPTPKQVLNAQLNMATELAMQGPAAWPMLQRVADKIEECRRAVAQFIGADPDEVVLTHNATEGIGIVAAGMEWQPGDEVIISDLEHASGILPWLHYAQRRGIKVVRLQSVGGTLSATDFAAAFSPRTRLVCMSHVSYSSGARLPVAEVSRLAKEKGIRVLVDAAQGVGQIAVDVHALGCDYYALPGQKWLLGPAGTGALYIRKDALESVQASSVGWASVRHDNNNSELQFHPNARRFEVATMHGPSLAGLQAAIEFLAAVGPEAVEEQIISLAHEARAILQSVPDLQVLGPSDPALWTGLLPFSISGRDPKSIVEHLWRAHRVVSRWIPQPYCVRLSLHVFTTADEIRQVATALQ